MADFQGPNMSHDWLMEIGSKMVTIMREEKERNEKMTDFQFEVGYQPNRTADTEYWYTVQEASSAQEAEQEMEKRYPSDKGYSFSPTLIPDNAQVIRV